MNRVSRCTPNQVVSPPAKFQSDENWRDLILFYEYFNGDTGAGLGASYQTGWTALAAKMIQHSGDRNVKPADAVAAVAAD